MKKIIYIIIVFMGIFMLSSCFKQKNHNEFFTWMDAYIALEKDVENVVAINLFFEDKPYDIEDVSNISFIDISDKINITKFTIDANNQTDKNYDSYGITLNYSANTTGSFKTTGVVITLNSNETIEYPVGDWKFDVYEQDEELVDSWSSVGASSNAEEFPYNYSVESGNYIKRIYYGEDLYTEGNFYNTISGAIDISNSYKSPYVYIKSKIIVDNSGKEIINSGKGTYCGALDFSEEDLRISKDMNQIR